MGCLRYRLLRYRLLRRRLFRDRLYRHICSTIRCVEGFVMHGISIVCVDMDGIPDVSIGMNRLQ